MSLKSLFFNEEKLKAATEKRNARFAEIDNKLAIETALVRLEQEANKETFHAAIAANTKRFHERITEINDES